MAHLPRLGNDHSVVVSVFKIVRLELLGTLISLEADLDFPSRYGFLAGKKGQVIGLCNEQCIGCQTAGAIRSYGSLSKDQDQMI